jgi:hypothetical protein
MLFLVISTPRPERPSTVVAARQSFWPWIANYEARGLCVSVYARAGRGAVAVLDVKDNGVLHRILTEWADIVPAQFDVYPLIDRAAVAVAPKRSATAPTRDQALWAPVRNRARGSRVQAEEESEELNKMAQCASLIAPYGLTVLKAAGLRGHVTNCTNCCDSVEAPK